MDQQKGVSLNLYKDTLREEQYYTSKLVITLKNTRIRNTTCPHLKQCKNNEKKYLKNYHAKSGPSEIWIKLNKYTTAISNNYTNNKRHYLISSSVAFMIKVASY